MTLSSAQVAHLRTRKGVTTRPRRLDATSTGGELRIPARRGGKTLEALVARGGIGITLTKIPNGVKFIGGGKTVHMKAPPDFAGTLDGGRSIWLDCKECSDATAFDASLDKLKPHQVETLIQHGRRGAVAGLLILKTRAGWLKWLDWTRLVKWKPTYPWDELPDVGPSTVYTVDWNAVVKAAEKGATA